MMKILAATDGSKPAEHAVDYAADLAMDKKAELIICSIIPKISHWYYQEDFTINYPKLEAELEKHVKAMTEKTLERVKGMHDGLMVSSIIKHGYPVNEILEIVKDENVDLIVMGNRGSGGILSWLLGSVSRSIIEACTTSVLVVKDEKFCQK